MRQACSWSKRAFQPAPALVSMNLGSRNSRVKWNVHRGRTSHGNPLNGSSVGLGAAVPSGTWDDSDQTRIPSWIRVRDWTGSACSHLDGGPAKALRAMVADGARLRVPR